MPVFQSLEENGRILRVQFVDPWRSEEMVAQFPEAKRIYDSATETVHLLIDMTRNRNGSPNALRAREAPAVNHPMAGEIAVYGASPFIKTLGAVVFRLARIENAKFFNTEAEALAYLRQKIGQAATVPGTE
ncbi:MAG: hypothetical protein DYG88_13385 [Chloroflexi bacterium CFX4]|nr:hypothetical protein [Chloroflexi bacterium CFX4]MDL1923523.1 hypothetical protein [Chloroflexi bacterium CFX3]